jgi:hypothetical protein
MSGTIQAAFDEEVRVAERWVLELEKQLWVAKRLLQRGRVIQKLNGPKGRDGLSERDLDLIKQYDTGQLPEVKALEHRLRHGDFKSLASELASARLPEPLLSKHLERKLRAGGPKLYKYFRAQGMTDEEISLTAKAAQQPKQLLPPRSKRTKAGKR